MHTRHILQHSKAKKILFLTTAATQQTFPQTHTVTTIDIKTNMRHLHTSIVSRHLVTRGNNKILCTPPPHTSSSEERLPRLTRRTLAQLRTNKSPFLKSYLHRVDAKSYPSPLCYLCNTHTHDTHHLFNCAHICTTLQGVHLSFNANRPVGLQVPIAQNIFHWPTKFHNICPMHYNVSCNLK